MNPPKLEYPASVASDFDDFDVDKREKRLTDRKLLESDETESWEDVVGLKGTASAYEEAN